MKCSPLVHTSDAALPLGLSDALGRIRQLTRERRHEEGLAAAQELLGNEPSNADTLYLLAANLRCLDRIPEALTILARLEQVQPRLSRLYQERGFCFLAIRDAPQAVAAFRQAVTQNPALLASWNALENLFRLIGDAKNSALAAEQLAHLRQLPVEIVQAGSLFAEGDFGAAETLLRAYMKRASHIEALRLLARIEQQRGALAEAERLLKSVIERAPDYRAARADFVRALLGRQKYLEARAEILGLLQLEPGNADYRTLYATASAGLGDHETAIATYREILRNEPAPPHVQVLLGHSLKAMGMQSEAIRAYRAAQDLRAEFGDAYWSLANLKTYRLSDSDIARMQDAIAAATQQEDRIHLHFALGSALESNCRYEESWRHYASGNALMRAQSGYRPEFAEIDTRQQTAICTQRFFAERAAFGAPDADPIFIVGLPRSGSTLIEQILASHSLVQGTQELNAIPRIVQELQAGSDPGDPEYPRALIALRPEDFRSLGERYLAETRAFRNGHTGAPFFIDKMPNNFRHIGLIHLMLPNAKIIDARREPMACCFSNLKQLFAAGQDFSYDMEFLARYYRDYLELMRHWDTVLPHRVHRVVHEDLIEDLEGSVRGMLEYCGLVFEPACLEFHKTVRGIATASSEQVRQPLNRESLNQWMNYRPWLHPLEVLLGDARYLYKAPR